MELVYLNPRGHVVVVRLPQGVTTLGRAPECGIVLEGDLVSRVHAQVDLGGTRAVFQDLGSSNGTRRNGAPVGLGEHVVLAEGDVIEIGDLCIGVANSPDLEATTPAAPAAGDTARSTAKLSLAAIAQRQKEAAAEHELGPRAPELLKSLELVASRLEVASAAIFLRHESSGLGLAAAHPSKDAASVHVGGVAVRVFAKTKERLLVVPSPTGNLRSIAAVPIRHADQTIGVLAVERPDSKKALGEAELSKLGILAARVAHVLTAGSGVDETRMLARDS